MAIWDRLTKNRRGRNPEEETRPERGGGRESAWGRRPEQEDQGRNAQFPGVMRARQGMMQQGGWQPDMQEQDPNEALMERLTATQTAETEEARRMGERMGAESLLEMAGIAPHRRQELAETSGGMDHQRLMAATATLMKYKAAKASVNKRVIEAQQWWKLKNWQEIRKERGEGSATTHPSNTGWLWNCIVGKHADAIDCYPEPNILPRMQDDKEEANRLSKIVPVVMEINDFEETYNDCSWQKMQEGTAVYGCFWNSGKLNGLGDIDIRKVNILNLYWEPGVSDIQDSQNVFYVSFENRDQLVKQFPELEGQINTTVISIEQYKTDDNIDMSDKAAVVDWYYKVWENGKTILHYCKYVNEICLYSSEEEGLEDGFYADGKYPFVLDPLFPVEGSPAGYGYIDVAKDTQADIDTLSQAMVMNAVARATPRYFSRKDGGINEKELMDLRKPLVHTNGNLGADSLRPIEVGVMGSDAHNMLQEKIDEIKFITGNSDVQNGGVPSGVTAASAIAALKEDSGRSSKDSTKAAYRAYRLLVIMVIERIRQFYDIPRQFRILGQDGQEKFVIYSNRNLRMQEMANLPGQEPGMRMPVFDIEVHAQRENAYTKLSQNELALQFYNAGLLNPNMTDQALMVIDMMDFRGKEELRKRIEAQGTMQQALMKFGQIALQLAAQYRPDIAPELMMTLQGVMAESGGVPMQAAQAGMNGGLTKESDNLGKPADPMENTIVRKARERSANASRPN